MLDTLVTGSKLTSIANAIRTAGGTSGTMTLDDMPTAIGNISGGGTDISAITSQIKTANDMFSSATATSLDLSDFVLPIATGMDNFLYYASCSEVTLPAGTMPRVSSAGRMFAYCSNLTTLHTTGFSLPAVTNFEQAFRSCSSLQNIDCSFLTSTALHNISSLFADCTNLKSVNLSNISTGNMFTSQWSDVFYNCSSLEAVIWATNKTTVQPLGTSTSTLGLNSTAIVYVPDALVADYQAATNWSVIASRIKGVSELPAEYKTLYGIS